MNKKIVGIVGSYRKNGVNDKIVSLILDTAKVRGAEIKKIFLNEKNIGYCRNCRTCTQDTDICVLKDDMKKIIAEIENADGIVIAAPVNYYDVTAITRTFLERLTPLYYWPWGSKGLPVLRNKKRNKKAVIVSSAGMPAFLIRIMGGSIKPLKAICRTLGANVIGVVLHDFTSIEKQPKLSEKVIRKAKKIGLKLVA